MRKDSQIIFALSTAFTLGIVGVTYYLYLQEQGKSPEPGLSSQTSRVETAMRPTQTAFVRTSIPIKCTQPNGSVFWTNATRCEGADLNNRLSFAGPVKKTVVKKSSNNRENNTRTSSSPSATTNKKTLKSTPREMVFACSFPIGMAQKIEKKSLSLKNNPVESVWLDSYCRWVREARYEKCGGLGEYLLLSHLCS